MSADRDSLRRQLRELRRAIPAAQRIAAAEALARRLLTLPFAPEAGHVAGYWAMDGEIALHAWLLQLPPTLTYCLPVLHENGCLRFAPWRVGEALVANRYGIPEPESGERGALPASQMALIVTPLVAFDVSGQRLGMGAGWYDRSLAARGQGAAPPWLVGAAFAAQQVDALAAEPWDVPLDAVCTEQDTFVTPSAASTPAPA